MASIFDLFRKIEKRSPEQTSAGRADPEYIIVGLGNPGEKYAGSRHNAGYMAIDHLADRYGKKINISRFNSLFNTVVIGSHTALLVKPLTFMNLSGTAVIQFMKKYKLGSDRIIILSDDVALDPGTIRIRSTGSAGGHNGLKNITECIGTEDFVRIKIGVGHKPTKEYDMVSWVLGQIPESDMKLISGRFDDIAEAVSLIADGKISQAMNECN